MNDKKHLLKPSSPNQAQMTTSDAITKKLRGYYSSVKEESIPERFLDLLEKLDEVEKSGGSKQ